MKLLGSTHLIFLAVTLLFLGLTSWAVRKMPRKWQNVMFALAAFLCAAGIFFRFAMGMRFDGGIRLRPLLVQMLQVCNFNFLLLPLCLIPKCKFLRQYAIFFSMVAASTALFSPSGDFANLPWNSVTILSSWFNHTFAVACPLWMMASGRETPVRKYVLPTAIGVVVYFTVAYGMIELLMANGILPAGSSFSFIYEAKGIPFLGPLHEAIGVPYFYLYPMIPLLVAYLYMFESLFVRPVYILYHGGEGKIRRLFAPIGATVRLPKEEITKDGHVFLGYSTKRSATSAKYPPGSLYIIPGHTTTLHAVWRKDE